METSPPLRGWGAQESNRARKSNTENLWNFCRAKLSGVAATKREPRGNKALWAKEKVVIGRSTFYRSGIWCSRPVAEAHPAVWPLKSLKSRPHVHLCVLALLTHRHALLQQRDADADVLPRG
ncbi:unnamed protein product [Boreogadus saida]